MLNNREKRLRKRWWSWVFLGILLTFGLWQLMTMLFSEKEKALRTQVRETVTQKFPSQAADFSRTIGLFPYAANDRGHGKDDPPKETVVLVHGLDDPGKVWQNLAPALDHESYAVWLMHYPNDQPIVESTRLVVEELLWLRRLDISRICIVAHSMGGLVSRELLTSPEIQYNRLVQQGKVPTVDRLIMVGTPNHGSQMARFRIFGEARDHIERLAKGQGTGLGFLLDGAGEAKIDLLPGSRFLTELNDRKHPQGVYTTIIAGTATPWNEKDIARWFNGLDQMVPGDRSKEIATLQKAMLSMANGLGDGLVTVESTRLQGVPHFTVRGTHLSMIRNITKDSRRVPPAVPIIIDTLRGNPLTVNPTD